MTGPFVDTNVLLYVLDKTEPAKQAIAREILAAEPPVMSAQVLGEFYWDATKKIANKVEPDKAAEMVEEFRKGTIVPLTSELVSRAIETSGRFQISYWDALIVEAAVAGGCKRLLTEDLNAGQTIKGVAIENPFA